MNETDRKLAQELLAAGDGSSAHRPAIEQAVNSMSEDAVSMAQTARRLVTAELAAKALPDEGALVEAMVRYPLFQDACQRYVKATGSSFAIAYGAFRAIRPHIAALQARAEAAEAENARLWECPKWVGDPAYEPKTLAGKLGYLVEECAEVLAAVGKTQRWGLESFNPEVPPEKRETNREWILREMLDLERAIGMVRAALGDKS